jgi:hypothetical protein
MTFSHNEGPEPLATVGALETGSAGKLESLLNATTPRPNQDAAHAHVSRALAEAQAEKIRAFGAGVAWWSTFGRSNSISPIGLSGVCVRRFGSAQRSHVDEHTTR